MLDSLDFKMLDQKEPSTEHMRPEDTTSFLSDNLIELLVAQVGHELFAFYEYTAIAVWFDNHGLPGFAAWATKQANDEACHMRRVLYYLTEAGIGFTLPSIPEAPAMASDVKGAVSAILNREKEVTQNWKDIAKVAMRDADVASIDLAQWFMREQMEEENLVGTIKQRVDMADTGTGILVLDKQLAEQYGE